MLSKALFKNGNKHWKQRKSDDPKNDCFKIFSNNREIAKKITQQGEPEYPSDSSNHVVFQKYGVAHIG